MSDDGQTPDGAPPVSQAGSENPAPTSQPSPNSAPGSTPATGNGNGSAPPSAPAPASEGASPDSAVPASGSGDCAEIPAYPHAVLTGEVVLAVQVPYPPDQASQMPHKFTLANDDNSYSQTMSLALDAQAGDADGTSVLTFKDMTENHAYTLQCDDGSGSPPYGVFQNIDYDKLIDTFAAKGDAAPPPSSSSSPPASTPPPSSPPPSSPQGDGATGNSDAGATQ